VLRDGRISISSDIGHRETGVVDLDQSWKKFPPSVHPDGFYESKIMLAHDRSLCLQPTRGLAHDWKCYLYEDGQDADWCEQMSTRVERFEIRHGWQYSYHWEGSSSPCECHCCRRWIHGRPEKGGGLHVRLWPCAEDDENQRFLLPNSGKGPIRLSRFPNRCLSVSGPMWPVGDSGEGHQITLWLCGHNAWHGQIWNVPEHGQGSISWAREPDKCMDAGRVNKDEKLEAKLQIWACQPDTFRGPNQQFLYIQKEKNLFHNTHHKATVNCSEDSWPSRLDGETCGECKVPVQLTDDGPMSCYGYCHSIGRPCISAHSAEHGCGLQNESSRIKCLTQLRDDHAVCECGDKFMRGNYGSLTEFWIDEGLIRKRVQEMSNNFGIKEFQFEYAFEGFSNPPNVSNDEWKCKMQNRPVYLATLKAAVEEVRSVEGRSWFAVHAAAVDRGDMELIAGQWSMPPEDVVEKLASQYFEVTDMRRLQQALDSNNRSSLRRFSARSLSEEVDIDTTQEQTYEELCGCDVGTDGVQPEHDPESRLMDIVNLNAAWAIKVVPRWAKFVKSLGFHGIHWDTLGDFGHWHQDTFPANPFGDGSPTPDVAGFLRAAVPILREYELEQTLNFVDGFGWDPTLLNEHTDHSWIGSAGRAIAFPYWEVWTVGREKHFFETVGADQYHKGFVLAMYPGYSKYHCCAKNERQNAAEYGEWPFDLGVKRWQMCLDHGGSYHFVVDGLRYLQGPFVADAVRCSNADVKRLRELTGNA